MTTRLVSARTGEHLATTILAGAPRRGDMVLVDDGDGQLRAWVVTLVAWCDQLPSVDSVSVVVLIKPTDPERKHGPWPYGVAK